MKTLVLGTFDGVHKGHKELIKTAGNGEIVACTFNFPPAHFFDNKLKVLSLPNEKEFLLKKCGVTTVYSREFSQDIAQMSAEEYIGQLCASFKPDRIVAGFNHRFGANAKGDCGLLCKMSTELGYGFIMQPQVLINGEAVSSSAIRALLAHGAVDCAAERLGGAYSVGGVVSHGNGIGASLGFPTANINVDERKMLPQNGVYITNTLVNGKMYRSFTNVGVNPTVGGIDKVRVESHIFNFDMDIYNAFIRVFFLKRLRDEKQFSSLSELENQLKTDYVITNSYINSCAYKSKQ